VHFEEGTPVKLHIDVSAAVEDDAWINSRVRQAVHRLGLSLRGLTVSDIGVDDYGRDDIGYLTATHDEWAVLSRLRLYERTSLSTPFELGW
jgi:hypothetical protein